MSFIIPPGCRSRQPINFGARVNPRYMARPEMVWVGGRSIGDKNGNFTRGSSLTDVAHGEAGLGIQFTGSTTNAYTRSGGSTVAQDDCTFVSVFSWTSGAANYRPQLCSFSSAFNSYRIGPTVDAGGDLALILSGVVAPVSVSITSGVTYVLVTSRQKSTGNCYMVAKPLGGGAVARSVASSTSAALAGNGTSCVGYAFGGGSYAWNGNIYLVAGSYEWMPESLARELLDDPYSLFRAPQRLFAAAAATGGSQDLAPSLYADADTFHAATVAPGAVDLTPSLYADADTFHAATVAQEGVQTLSPSLYADADTFHVATVAPGAVDLTPEVFVNASNFYVPTASAVAELAPTLVEDADTFHAATVAPGAVDLTPEVFVNASNFYVPAVSGDGIAQNLAATLFVNASAIPAHDVWLVGSASASKYSARLGQSVADGGARIGSSPVSSWHRLGSRRR